MARNSKVTIHKILILLFIPAKIVAMEKSLIEKPTTASLKVIVSTLKRADVHLLLESDANALDLKEKVALYDSIDIKNARVYLIKTKLGIFQTKSEAIADIQKLKEVIEHHQTNKFLVCLTPSKK